MYLLLIYFLILVVPIAVMPGYIRTGKMSPYRTVMQATLIVTVMTVIVFMVASMTGKGVFAQLQELIDDMAKELANNPMVEDSLNLASVSKACLLYTSSLRALQSFPRSPVWEPRNTPLQK